MRMSQNAVKKPQGTLELGESVLSYLRSTMDFGLHYPVGVPVDADPDLARRVPRKNGTVEVLVDASFSPGDSHSVSGTVILLAGCPVQWESRRQSLMALSTAEAELTALVEGLQTGRSVRSLVQLLLPEVDLELYNDNRAAVVLASGAGRGWRTRHLRIRASCLAEALKMASSLSATGWEPHCGQMRSPKPFRCNPWTGSAEESFCTGRWRRRRPNPMFFRLRRVSESQDAWP